MPRRRAVQLCRIRMEYPDRLKAPVATPPSPILRCRGSDRLWRLDQCYNSYNSRGHFVLSSDIVPQALSAMPNPVEVDSLGAVGQDPRRVQFTAPSPLRLHAYKPIFARSPAV